MAFKVAVVFFSRRGRLAVLANVIAAGARQVPGAEVRVYRVKDPVRGDDPQYFEDGVLDAEPITEQAILEADAIIAGAPGRQGGMCGEMRLFLDTWAKHQTEQKVGFGALKGKVGSAFTSVGGNGRGFGGHEAILQSFHATFLQHGMVVVGNPPSSIMDDTMMASPFGVVMAGKEDTTNQPTLSAPEVKLAYSMGGWTAQISRMLHDADMDKRETNMSFAASSPIAIDRSGRSNIDATSLAASCPQ
ncbi:hypothetical protein ABBQ38_013970 [Trebouxia sp. C0009 RCD-2024]